MFSRLATTLSQVFSKERIDLCEKFIKLLTLEDWSGEQSGGLLYLLVTTLYQLFQLLSTKRIDVDIDVLKHEAFKIRSFVKFFTNYFVDQNLVVRLLSYPIMPINYNDEPLYLLDHILVNNRIILAEGIISHNERFLRQNTTLGSESVCVVINELPKLLSTVLNSSTALLNSACSPKHSSCLNDRYTDFKYPLIFASTLNKTDSVKCLLEHGARINVKNNKGRTALHCAAYFGHSDVMK